MKQIKLTYKDSAKKRAVREFLLDRFSFGAVTGLAGPDIDDYIAHFEAKGVKKFDLYETNSSILVNQLTKLGKTSSDIKLIYGDILEASSYQKGRLYDLDFCASIKHLTGHVKKFKNNFIMTFSVRGVSKNETLKIFFDTREEQVLSKEEFISPIKHSLIKTNKGNYLFTTYKDTAPMCCIAKI